MQRFDITPRQNPARRLSRAHAFEAQGVTLRYPVRSWSGVRVDDGTVVLAMREADVQVDEEGSSCLLWAPLIRRATEWMDWLSMQERLAHCRLAVGRGHADGLLVCGEAAQVEPDAVLTLRVEKRRDEYWATWGAAARAQGPRLGVEARVERFCEARIAA